MNRKLIIIIVVSAVIIGVIAGVAISFFRELPQVADLKENRPNLATKIFDCNGELIDQLYVEQRTLISLNKVPQVLQKAVIAVEDENFFSHFGVDPIGIVRALFVNILHGRVIQGGSTITQQLARNLFLTRKRSMIRKIKEALLSMEIEKKYTKKEILEMYLNQIYFGSGAYGVEAAARTYFGKHVDELSVSECALLAGLPRAPNEYSPYKNPERALSRRNSILTRLAARGIISKREALKSKKEPISLNKIEIKNAPYFVEYIRQQLEETYGSNVIYKGGLNVYTTLDLNMQDLAERTLMAGIMQAEKVLAQNNEKKLQGAMLVMEVATGNIKAMIGGRSFKESEFNRAVQARRQPGSAFKPFVYLTAIDNGFTPADIIVDSPVVFKDSLGNEWKPENYERKFFGATTLRNGLAYSRNVVTVKLLGKVGIDNVINCSHRVGIKSELTKDMTLALGTSEVTLLELVSSFSVFPNMGLHVDPIALKSIKDFSGKVIEDYNSNIEEVIKPESAYVMINMMESVINYGTAKIAKKYKIPISAGKTGTTDNNTDAWFIGFTPEFIVGVWVGYDDRSSIGNWATASQIAVPIWADFMSELYKGKEIKDFAVPENIVTAKIDTSSGLLATKDCKETIEEIFIKGTVPTKYCDMHKPKLPF